MHESALDLNSYQELEGLGHDNSPLQAPENPVNCYLSPKTTALLTTLEAFSTGAIPVALLTGALSSGKTTLLKILKDRVTVDCCLFQGFAKLDLRSCFDSLPLDESCHPQMSLAELKQLMNQPRESGLLIIDDADFLSMEKLELLICAYSQQTESRYRLLLVGENSLQKRVGLVCERLGLESVQKYLMEPFTQNETLDYLKQLQKTNLANRQAFSNETLKKIYTLSEGYIGRINRVATHLASELKTSKVKMTRTKSYVDFALTLGIICLLAVVGYRMWTLITEDHSEKTTISTSTKKHLVHRQIASSTSEPNQVIALDDNTPSFIASIEGLPEEHLPKADPVIELPAPQPLLLQDTGSGQDLNDH